MNEFMDTNTVLTQSRAIARALRTISSATGKSFTMRTKPGRFALQKTVYLLKRSRYPPAERFDYNIYLNGPYSPDLAQVYYALEDDGLAHATPDPNIPPPTVQMITDALAHGEDFLEGLTTVIDGIPREGSPGAALGWARSIKPHLSEATWREVRTFLGAHPELTRRT